MPYVKVHERDIAETNPKTSGQLNFAITKLLIGYMDREGLSYQTINDCLGALEGAKLEFYRRVAEPYENKKIVENGDVYPGPLPKM